MSLQVFLSNTGKRLLVELQTIHTADALKGWIEEQVGITGNRQILMTAKGKNVKLQHLLPDGEIYVYDKAVLAGDIERDPFANEPFDLPSIEDFPSTLEDATSLQAWQELFTARREWAAQIGEIVRSNVQRVDEYADACDVLARCTQVAVENLHNHFLTLQQNGEKTQSWAREFIAEQTDTLAEWKNSAKVLSEIPVRKEIACLLQPSQERDKDTVESDGTLLAVLNASGLERSAQGLEQATVKLGSELKALENSIRGLDEQTKETEQLLQVNWPNLNTQGLVEEAETCIRKINKDCEETMKSASDSRSVSVISRRAYSHTQELLPALVSIAQDTRQMVEDGISFRGRLSQNCRTALQQISNIQSQFAGIKKLIADVKLDEKGQECRHSLGRVFHLPIAYGSTLVEAIRRSEWHDKVSNDFNVLQDEVSQHKNEERRRRRRWVESLNGYFDVGDNSTAVLLDYNFVASKSAWPSVAREEIFAYVEDLRALGIDEAVEHVTRLLKDLDSAEKSRKPRAKTFKNGSVHDVGQSVLLNGDEIRALQDDKLRLEDKVRASESRIRKLEDVLHRQSQLTQPASGLFTPHSTFERASSSPGMSFQRPSETSSRRPSVSLRRLSNQNLDEKAMVQRIASLEGQIAKLQEEAHAERRSSTESRDRMNEAESVKRDLMANFDSQRQEFDDERQRLEDEAHDYKIRVEELEDELDRIVGSRDHQKMTQDQTIASLKMELERLRKSTTDELDQLKRSKDEARSEMLSHKERVAALERQLQQHRDDKVSLQSQHVKLANQLRSLETEHQDFASSLQAAHTSLSPTGRIPENLSHLVRSFETLAEGAAFHARAVEDKLNQTAAENKAQEEEISRLEHQLKNSSLRIEQAEKSIANLRAELAGERSRLATTRSELSVEQAELQKLRDKFAAGETGSDDLRSQLESEEKRVAELLESVAERNGQIEAQQHEISSLLAQVEQLDITARQLRSHLESRRTKAQDLSRRLFDHNDRIIRMLESFGYSISRQDESLVIQRASKVSASTTLTAEGSTPMKRMGSGPSMVQHYSDPTDSDKLFWSSGEDPSTEDAQYEAFVNAMSRFDFDATMETVSKRYKDVETLAKKYQKDTRAYRDRYHRLQSDAHDKIAYRSFKEGDLALFLPTRNQATRPWAAFNVGAPHYFLREQDAHRLQSRDWLLARITKVDERVVDLSRSLTSNTANAAASDGGSMRSVDDENPFELSDGLRWYMIDAVEEKPGAPSTPGLGKSTAAASVVEVKGHMSRRSLTGREVPDGSHLNVAKTLSKSLDSRRSSEASRKSVPVATLRGQNSSGIHAAATAATASGGGDAESSSIISKATPTVRPSDADAGNSSPGQAREDARVFDVVRKDLLLGP